jgi:hypothetical protein
LLRALLEFCPVGSSENSFWGREQLSPNGQDRVPAGYAGIQLPSHWSIFANGYFGDDWGIQAIAAFAAKPYIDYVVRFEGLGIWVWNFGFLGLPRGWQLS